MANTGYYTTGENPRVIYCNLGCSEVLFGMRCENPAMPAKTKHMKDSGIRLNDLPEIAILNREIERFEKTMLKNPSLEEEESYRGTAERHFLNGLLRAKELLLLDHYQTPQ